MKRVYVAGKLNDSDATAYIRNCHTMIYNARMLKLHGFSVFVPCLDLLMGLVDGHYEYGDYFDFSQPWLDVSDAVFAGDGWQDSPGTLREIERAELNDIPVFYSIADIVQWGKD